MNKRTSAIIILIVALILSSFVYLAKFFTPKNELVAVPGEAVFHFIDVGQGDCIFIQSEDVNILIDSGTYNSGSVIYKYLKELGVDCIDYFIGTHPHEDHMGGAATVLSSIDVETVFINGEEVTGFHYDRFVDVLAEKDICPTIPDLDCVYEIGDFRIKFLSPKELTEDENNNSLVFTVQFGNIKALFTGDAERSVEAELLKNKKLIDADILKVGHHGSRYASSAAFLNAVSPSVSVIQCGEGNSYGHPHDETIKRLNDISSTVYQTYKDGTVVFRTDGKTLKKTSGEEFKKNKSSPIETVYIGNMKSMVFHSEACANLPSENNRIDFASREEAINLGYKVCGNCNP